MWLEGTGDVTGRRVEAQGDGRCVLVSRIECVAQLHQECVAAPVEAILDE